MSEPWPSIGSDESDEDTLRTAAPPIFGPKWTWPERTMEPFPLSCRFVPNDQWFRTHVDPSWTVERTKQHLLSKCQRPAPSSALGAPASPVRQRTIKLSLRPFRRDKDKLKMTHMRMPSTPAVEVVPPSPSSDTGLLQLQEKSAQGRASIDTIRKRPSAIWGEEGYMLFSFCNGNILNDDLFLWQTLLRPYDLVELQSPAQYTSLDRNLRYLEPYYHGSLDLFSEYEDEIDTVTQSLDVTIRYSMLVLTGKRKGGKEPVLSLSLTALYILEEVVVPFPLDRRKDPPAFYIRAVFRVPGPDREKVWSEQHFSGQTYNFLCADETSHDHLLRVLAFYWRSNTKSSTPHLDSNSFRLRTYRRAFLRDSVFLKPLEASGPGTELEGETEDDPGSESEKEWVGWREVYDEQGLLRSRKSAGGLRETGTSLERTRTR